MDIARVIIVDDHVIFRKGLYTILNEIDFVKVVGEASNGNELLELLKKQSADVILMDIKMPVMDGIEATKKVSAKYPAIKIIALTMFEEISYFNKMIEAGASGFLLKKTTSEELERALNLVLMDESYFSEEFMSSVNMYIKPKQKESSIVLTDREQEVLELICKGYSNIEIANFLGVSSRTVDGFRARLFEKTGAKNAPNLVMFAIKNGLVN
ncbi:MAG: response regulator transcription factor [Bacteroidales bacterium]|nr:response regulator transcription factor [Bacteroidales bacterium]